MSSTATTRNLVVLGMHRSGTSMVSRALVQCGLQPGDPAALLNAQQDNPQGFWERRDVVALNDRMLEAAGGSWYSPVVEAGRDGDYTEQIGAIIGQLQQPWLLKDPRLVLTWPLWQEQLQDAVIICVCRRGAAVAQSLRQRNGFPLEFGLALWEFYNRRMAQVVSGHDYVTVCYDAFCAEPVQQLQLLVERLIDAGVAIKADLPEPAAYWSAELNHFSGQQLLAQELMSPAQLQLEAAWQQHAADPAWPLAIEAPDKALCARLQDFAEAYQHNARARVVDIELESVSAQLTHEREVATQQLAEREALKERERRHVEEYSVLKAQHQELSKQQLHLEKIHAELQERADQQAAATAELQAVNEALERQLNVERQAVTEKSRQLEQTYRSALQFHRSAVGRIQGVIAFIYKTLTLRWGNNTAFDDIVDAARGYASGRDRAFAEGRFAMLARVLGYVLRHPVSSLHSFSWYRLRRIGAVFLSGDKDDLALWVRQRFPDDASATIAVPTVLDGIDLATYELEFPVTVQPLVSIIVPAYNEYAVTVVCLRSILEFGGDIPYEVIIADDASTDLTRTLGTRMHGAIHCRSKANLGFVRNCNHAAKIARGEYLLLLNNDTAVTAGWLEPMVRLLRARPEVGVVGPKLLFAGGELQEAGGIVWKDASGWNYGRMDDPALPEYNYVKPVDYISGACLLTRRSLWEQLGGFDERYVPAYYEDTDYCFAVRAAGYEVVYQPAAEIFHFEGISNGTDLGSGIKQYQVTNREKFQQKWRSVLETEHYPNGESVFRARDRSRERRTVLVIDHYVPHFDKDAGSRSTWLYLQLLVEMGYNVKFIGANFFPHQPYTLALQQAGIEVLVGERMARKLNQWLREQAPDIDAIYIHRPYITEQFMEILQELKPRPRMIYFGHDLHYLRTEREAALRDDAGLLKEAASWRDREFAVFSVMDHIYYPSQVEVDAILELRPELKVQAIPLYVYDSVEALPYVAAERADMLFVGGFNHPPNADGLRWFVAEILPRLAAAGSNMKLHIVGSNMPDDIAKLAGAQVVVHGFLSDQELAELYARVAVVVVPLRFGAGVKGKVIEALQHGLPIVTTSIGAEGLPNPAAVMQIADEANEFATSLLKVEHADAEILALMVNYPDYFNKTFAKELAAAIIARDFGAPSLKPVAGEDVVTPPQTA